MSTWTREHTERTTAAPAAVWARWTDARTWPVDDPAVEWAAFNGPPRTGSSGSVKNHRSPLQSFTFTAVEPHHRMDLTVALPLARLAITHRMEPDADGLLVTHGVRLSGPLGLLYAAVLGRSMAAALPQVVRTVVAAARTTG